MSFKKNLNSEASVVIAGGNKKKLFTVGFKYMMDSIIFTVISTYNSDNTEFRTLSRSDGTREEVTVETIIKDFKEAGKNIIVLEDPNNPKKEVITTTLVENKIEESKKVEKKIKSKKK